MKKVLSGAACAVLIGFASSAYAIPTGENFVVDFRSWGGAHGLDSYTMDGVTAEALPNDTLIDYKLNHDVTDGLGIKWFLDADADEIEYREQLLVTSAGFEANGAWITNLYPEPDGSDPINGEAGRLILNGLYEFDFFGKNSSGGDYWIDFGGTFNVTTALFQALPYTYTSTFFGREITKTKWDDNEFSVAGFTGAPVPEPATMILFGTGLAGLAAVGRRRKS